MSANINLNYEDLRHEYGIKKMYMNLLALNIETKETSNKIAVSDLSNTLMIDFNVKYTAQDIVNSLF